LETPLFLGEENPFFSIKRVFLPQTPTFPKRTTKGLAALWTLGKGVCFEGLGLVACVTGVDVSHDLQRAVFSLRDGA
jgi:hypothetical protein